MSKSNVKRNNELTVNPVNHVHDGFVYKRDGVSKDKSRIFWLCVRRGKEGEGCLGRIHTTADGERTFVKMINEHNCSYKWASTSANGPPLQKGNGEKKKRSLWEAQRIHWQPEDEDQNLALVVANYAATIRSVGELFELVQGNVCDDPIDFTNLNDLQHSIFIKEMARKMEKLRVDFERTESSECGRCGKQIEKIGTENLAMIRQLEGTSMTPWKGGSRDWHRIVQTVKRDSECASLAIHTFLYHPTELWPTLRCLFGSESDALNCYPFLDFRKSLPDLFACYICQRHYPDLMAFLRHADMYHKATTFGKF